MVEFFSFYNSTVLYIVEFTGHLLSDEILLAVREWEREGMGIANGNGKGMGIKLRAKPVIGNGNEPLGMGVNRIEIDIPAHHTLAR